jgi:hypothetical protein
MVLATALSEDQHTAVLFADDFPAGQATAALAAYRIMAATLTYADVAGHCLL